MVIKYQFNYHNTIFMILIYEQRFCELEFPQQNRMIHNNKWSNYFQANEAIHERFPQVVLPWVKLIGKSLHEGPKILFIVKHYFVLTCYYIPWTKPLKTIIDHSFHHCHQVRSFQNWHCGITTVDLCHHANINYWYHGGIFVNCSCN